MNRSSGILIFAGGFFVCTTAILCCLQIQGNARAIRCDQLVSPSIRLASLEIRKPRNYVLMNPIKPEYHGDLDRQRKAPNILVASLPATESVHPASQVLAGHKVISRVAERFAAEQLGEFHPAVWAEDVIDSAAVESLLAEDVASQLAEDETETGIQDRAPTPRNPFSFASGSRATDRSHGPSPLSEIGHWSAELVAPPAPHLAIANDPAILELRNAIRFLRQIDLDQVTLESIQHQLNQLVESGSSDPGLCESILYRLQSEVESLTETGRAEDDRLIETVREGFLQQISDWIDQLNGIEPVRQALPKEEIDFQKINTAVLSLLQYRLF